MEKAHIQPICCPFIEGRGSEDIIMWTCKALLTYPGHTVWDGAQLCSRSGSSGAEIGAEHQTLLNPECHLQNCGFNDVPRVHQRRIVEMADIPLRELAQLACLCKDIHALYLERVQERDAHVANLLVSYFRADFREGLTSAQTALPRDLIVDFRVGIPFPSWSSLI
jgi:hypothetical protein